MEDENSDGKHLISLWLTAAGMAKIQSALVKYDDGHHQCRQGHS